MMGIYHGNFFAVLQLQMIQTHVTAVFHWVKSTDSLEILPDIHGDDEVWCKKTNFFQNEISGGGLTCNLGTRKRNEAVEIVSSLVRNFDPEKSPKSIMLR